ncbi:MAG: hypothetical protein R3F46_01330 [bacterium]
MTDTSESDAFDLDTDYFDGYAGRALLTFNEADSSIRHLQQCGRTTGRNGIVSMADLVPLARNFGYPVGNPPLKRTAMAMEVIGLGDLVPIARHMGQATTRMYLFGSWT